MEKEYLYLFKSICGNYFKIGKTKDLNTRIKTLNKKGLFEINISESVKFEVKENQVLEIEKNLHNIYKNFNYLKDNQKEEKEGYTEWFKIDCYEMVLNQISHFQEAHFHIGEKENIEIKDLSTKKVVSKEKKQKKEETKETKFMSKEDLIKRVKELNIESFKITNFNKGIIKIILKTKVNSEKISNIFDLCGFNEASKLPAINGRKINIKPFDTNKYELSLSISLFSNNSKYKLKVKRLERFIKNLFLINNIKEDKSLTINKEKQKVVKGKRNQLIFSYFNIKKKEEEIKLIKRVKELKINNWLKNIKQVDLHGWGETHRYKNGKKEEYVYLDQHDWNKEHLQMNYEYIKKDKFIDVTNYREDCILKICRKNGIDIVHN